MMAALKEIYNFVPPYEDFKKVTIIILEIFFGKSFGKPFMSEKFARKLGNSESTDSTCARGHKRKLKKNYQKILSKQYVINCIHVGVIIQVQFCNYKVQCVLDNYIQSLLFYLIQYSRSFAIF